MITKIAEQRKLGKRLVRGHPMLEAEVVLSVLVLVELVGVLLVINIIFVVVVGSGGEGGGEGW